DVDHKIHVVQQDPLSLVVTLNVRRAQTRPGESLLYLIRDGLYLPRVATARNYKIVGEDGGVAVHLQQGEIFGLFFLGGADRLGHPLPQLCSLSICHSVARYECSRFDACLMLCRSQPCTAPAS